MIPNPENLLKIAGIPTPLIGFYDTPDPSPFEPLISPKPSGHACIFAFYETWLNGQTLHIMPDNSGCGGANHWLFGIKGRTRENFVKFLVDDEGLKASHDLMNKWLDVAKPYQPEHPNILIGPLKADQYEYLKTVTFFVNPDQLSLLLIGAYYNCSPTDPPPVIAPFGSGCSELVSLFHDLNIPQAMIGATDIAMRQYLPPDTLAFTVTKPMYKRFCSLGKDSFLYKPFWQRLRKSRGENQNEF
jgi:hypothetical protein